MKPRYLVMIEPYSLLPGEVGKPVYAGGGIESRHSSLKAAGRMLGSMISGKRRKRATPNTALWMYIYDTQTGAHISRNEAKGVRS